MNGTSMTSTRPTRDQALMQVAGVFATRSTCSRAHVGVVIARDGRILSTGYNGAPAGMGHCDHSNEYSITLDPIAHKEMYGSAGKPPDPGCKVAVHAEANAIAYAAQHGIKLDGADLYSTYMPCLACAQLVINAGIRRVLVRTLYRDRSGMRLLQAAKIEIMVLDD